ncbi:MULTISPECIES: heat-inducible transcriptional repressor HrcA [Clostridium]|jgi:heat-inducible transcriptional repressor|uniref:heat-inducible transcriptional repressor HrcA n=1 Tax=Clostridium TaxID=1485 RepID=UPI00028876D1|nr:MULTISPECIES: heat-inducible transcriptional repressor HrcA [Clostridium]MDF2502855.1 heat shock repressor HrcA [Clostridium sp.]
MDMIDGRKLKILSAIINDYINTAEPVGSRTIAKKYDLGISSATIRNEMADLEDMGYIEQLHSSSGRKPSDKGYRFYVDQIMQISRLSPEEENIIKKQLIDSALFEVDRIVRQATILLSELTKLISVVKTPSVEESRIKSIQLMGIDNNILSVIVTDSGLIRNNIIRVNKPLNGEALNKINNLLNVRLKNLSINMINLEVINNLKRDLCGYEDIFDAIIPHLYDSLNTNSNNSEVYFEGLTNILNYPEFKDIEKARKILSFVDDGSNIKNILDSKAKISIRIGHENYIQGAKECSIISAIYSLGDRQLGSIGVIGPTRIPYSKVVSILTKVTKELNKNINKIYLDD